MERHEILEAMTERKLYGMRASFDAIAGKGLNRRDEIFPLLASLIRAERTHRQARSISYRMSGARFPVLTSRFASLAGANETLARILPSSSSPTRRSMKVGSANSRPSHSGTFPAFRWRTPTCRNAGLACRQPNARPARSCTHGAT
jgi:hypothetical protein